ncbi:uncharacterized protein [Henckelia pumila]|uniref:uncharacterized protein n=1 Tax=Henckelia pumila TaxID=405737 RepID=UPI003C6E37E4
MNFWVLSEIHEGCCGNHLDSIALVRKALLAGLFWPTMQKVAFALIYTCYNYQRPANLQLSLAEFMKVVMDACPFDQWGMDIVGTLSISTGQRNFLLVAVDYFSKWVEAKPLAKIIERKVLSFLWKNIVCRFGIPRRLISDNERQFCGSKVRAWCEEMKIEQVFTSVAYPQGNGQVEVTNITIVQALKPRLDTAKGKSGSGETPYNMVYGTESVLPAEIGQESARIIAYGENNKELRAMDLDLVEESRVREAVCDILEEKPLMSRSENDAGEPPWVASSWLRHFALSASMIHLL